MSMRAGTPVTDTTTLGGAAEGLGPTSSMGTSARAGYNPYMVGNDMGLWTPNKNWINYIEEVMPEIMARLGGSDPRDYMTAAAAHIILGKGGAALEIFNEAARLSAPLPAEEAAKLLEIIHLGMGTAYIVLGNEEAALTEYENALRINPHNEAAKINISVLRD